MADRVIVRTPKRPKVWGLATPVAGSFINPADITANALSAVDGDLLSDLAGDLLAIPGGGQATVMRTIGTFILGNGVDDSVLRTHAVHLGIAWIPSGEATADPAGSGIRDTLWIWRDTLWFKGQETTPTNPDHDSRQDLSFMRIDRTQMRRQPTPNHKLKLMCRHQSDGGGTHDPRLWFTLQFWLAT